MNFIYLCGALVICAAIFGGGWYMGFANGYAERDRDLQIERQSDGEL